MRKDLIWLPTLHPRTGAPHVVPFMDDMMARQVDGLGKTQYTVGRRSAQSAAGDFFFLDQIASHGICDAAWRGAFVSLSRVAVLLSGHCVKFTDALADKATELSGVCTHAVAGGNSDGDWSANAVSRALWSEFMRLKHEEEGA